MCFCNFYEGQSLADNMLFVCAMQKMSNELVPATKMQNVALDYMQVGGWQAALQWFAHSCTGTDWLHRHS